MSNLLKEAIVDAKALRETALRTAESSIIEKYSDEVRKTLDKILEQEDLGAPQGLDSMTQDMGMEAGPSISSDDVVEDVPLAAADDLAEEEGEITDSIEDGESVEISLDLPALEEAVKAFAAELDEQEVELADLESILEGDDETLEEEEETIEEEDELEEGSLTDTTDKVSYAGQIGDEKAGEAADRMGDLAQISAIAAESVESELDEDALLAAIMEKLTVDVRGELGGWAGRSAEDVIHETERELAHRRSTDVQEELEDLKQALEDLVLENKQATSEADKYKQAFYEMKENLEDVNLSNARLLYTNRVLRNTSLNERQKDKIVEAISSAGSVTEARTIFKTLESAVESVPNKAPKSLSEAITRPTSVIRASRQETAQTDSFSLRMKKLAGIN